MSTIFVKPYSGLVNIFICLENDSVRVSKYCDFKNKRLFNLNIKFQDVVFRSGLRTELNETLFPFGRLTPLHVVLRRTEIQPARVQDKPDKENTPRNQHVGGRDQEHGLPHELDADENLRDDHGAHHPSLLSEPFATLVAEKIVSLPCSHHTAEEEKNETEIADPVVGWHRESGLQVEHVELSQSKHYDES